MKQDDKNEIRISRTPLFIDTRSDAFTEIVARPNKFINTWAVPVFFFIVVLLFGFTWFIHYPEIIKARTVLIASNGPRELYIRKDGKLLKLLVKNDEMTKSGTLLGYIESNAAYEHVLLLKRMLDSTVSEMEKDDTKDIEKRFNNAIDSLGELQPNYQQFSNAVQQYKDYKKSGFFYKKKNVLVTDLSYLQKNHLILEQQKELLAKDLKLSEESYIATQSLLKEKVLSKQDDRNEQSKLLNKQLTIPQINTSLIANENQQREKQKEISELEHTISSQAIIFAQTIQTLQSNISDWEKNFLIKAPIDGKVTLQTLVQENQYFKAGSLFGFINPASSNYYAKINLPQFNFGKIEIGQKLQVHFDAYPYQEFGSVTGKLSYLSTIAFDSGFIAYATFPNGLITNQNKSLQYRDGLKGEVQIITKDMKLLERFYYNISSTLKQ